MFNMSPTDRIKAVVGEPIPEKDKWSNFDTGGVEVEVGELLFGLIRAIKPNRVIESGLYSGISCMYMALALQENKFGHIDTLEYESEHIKRSKERIVKLGVQDYVTIHNTDSLKFDIQGVYELMFLDTEINLRLHELVKYFDHLSPGGLVLIHDMNRELYQGNVNNDHPNFKNWPLGEIPPKIIELVNSGQLRPFHIPSARGIQGFYRPHEGDYL